MWKTKSTATKLNKNMHFPLDTLQTQIERNDWYKTQVQKKKNHMSGNLYAILGFY